VDFVLFRRYSQSFALNVIITRLLLKEFSPPLGKERTGERFLIKNPITIPP